MLKKNRIQYVSYLYCIFVIYILATYLLSERMQVVPLTAPSKDRVATLFGSSAIIDRDDTGCARVRTQKHKKAVVINSSNILLLAFLQ